MVPRSRYLLLFIPGVLVGQDSLRPSPQNPSPMTESTRRHERVAQQDWPGVAFSVTGVLPTAADVFVPERSRNADMLDILVHFLGAPYVVRYAAQEYRGDIAAVGVNLGSGSRMFGAPFEGTGAFGELLDSVAVGLERTLGRRVKQGRVYLSGFSAGYGSIRAILRNAEYYERVAGVLLLDGIHASYMPERKVLADGGTVDTTHLDIYLKLSADASRQESAKKFLITHSDVFPGTFVSTTEATDVLIGRLGLRRTPVLDWGPLGMQQLSIAGRGHFRVLGFAGNSGQDHGDHLHALFHFLNIMTGL